ncbi:MAG: potassium transporter Kef [Candidatus Parcubacteria bacterium]|nr:MAG: potassium transporter Kef [Candidatus Parcubacteria bacterium]
MTPFLELTIIFLFTALIAFLFRLLKQPLIISYIFAGLILSNYLFKFTETKALIEIFSDLGIAFLLFIVGLELKLNSLREIGRQAIIIGTLQEIFTIIAGFLIAKILGFGTTPALYLGAALSFSSTIIMVKLISDKGDIEKLYGKLAIGFLLVQDLITILILFLLPFFKKEIFSQEAFLQLSLGLIAIPLIPYLAYRFLPRIEKFLTRSEEFLFLFALAFGLGISSLFKYLGLGIEAGALIAGISLSNLISSTEIASKLKPLRDFFLILFFILIGSKIFIFHFDQYLWQVIVLSLFVLIGNPLIMLLLLGLLGYKSRTSFLLGLTSAQISEFSFILISLGIKFGHLSEEILSITALVGLITIFLSTYFFAYAEKIYLLLERYLKIFERKKTREEKEEIPSYEVILFGCDRIGYSFLNVLRPRINTDLRTNQHGLFKPRIEMDKNRSRINADVGTDKRGLAIKNFLIVDYNFELIKKLKKEGFNVIYGDAEEIDFLQSLNLTKTKLIISTIPDFETNLLILQEYKKENPEGIFIATAYRLNDALDLYKNNADYVIMPHFLGGEFASNIIEKFGFNKDEYLKLKEKSIAHIQQRYRLGHEHP